MTHKRLQTNKMVADPGIQTWWSGSRATDPVKLERKLRSLGITASVVRKRTKAAALKMAITELVPYRLTGAFERLLFTHNLIPSGIKPPFYRLVRALQDKTQNGYAVLLELRDAKGVKIDTVQLGAARVDATGSSEFITTWSQPKGFASSVDLDPYNLFRQTTLQQRYDFFRTTIGAEELGELLTRILESLPMAQRIGMGKGIWHVPQISQDMWCDVADAVEACNVDTSPSVVSTCEMQFTGSTLAATLKAIEEELTKRCGEIMQEARSSMGQRAASNRLGEIARMRVKMAEYTPLVGQFQQSLVDMVQDAEVACSTAMALDSDFDLQL